MHFHGINVRIFFRVAIKSIDQRFKSISYKYMYIRVIDVRATVKQKHQFCKQKIVFFTVLRVESSHVVMFHLQLPLQFNLCRVANYRDYYS